MPSLFRGFAERVLYHTLVEVIAAGSYKPLTDALMEEKKRKSKAQKTILK